MKEAILSFFESTPQWILFILIGAAIAFVAIGILKRTNILAIIFIVIVLFLISGVDFNETFKDFSDKASDMIEESEIIEKAEQKGGSIFERIFDVDEADEDDVDENEG